MDNKKINLTGSGYQIEIAFEITNGIYFRCNEHKMIIASESGRIYSIESTSDLPIQDSKGLRMQCGPFVSREEADEYMDIALLNLQMYLCSISTQYRLLDKHVSDLSVVEMRGFMFCEANLSLIRPWDMPQPISMKTDAKAKKALDIFKLATEAKDTSVAFMLLVIAFESLADNYRKDEPICQLLDGFIKQVEASHIAESGKKSLNTVLQNMKREGATASIKKLVERLGLAENHYGTYTAKSLISKSYGLRSSFAHDGIISNPPSDELRKLLTDVLRAYMQNVYAKANH